MKRFTLSYNQTNIQIHFFVAVSSSLLCMSSGLYMVIPFNFNNCWSRGRVILKHFQLLSYFLLAYIGSSRKSQTGRLRTSFLQGFQRNIMCNFQGLIKNKSGISRGDQEKIMYFWGLDFWPWNFQWEQYSYAEFPGVRLYFVWNFQG